MQNQERISLQPVHNLKPYKRVQGTHQVERFFRVAAGLVVDKDIRRYCEFVDQKVIDLLTAQHTAKANDRVRVEPHDLPITKGLQENIHAFEVLCRPPFCGLGRTVARGSGGSRFRGAHNV